MTDDAIRAALAEALRAVQPYGTWAPEDAAANLLPTVRRLMQQQAADELRAVSAEVDGWSFDTPDANAAIGEVIDQLNARAAALAPEPS